MYLDQGVNAVFATGDNFHIEGRSFIPKQPDAAGESNGVHSTRVRVRESVNNSLSPSFSNAGLDNDQDIGTMSTVEFVGMGSKHPISCTLTVPSNHLHGQGKGSERLIGDSP